MHAVITVAVFLLAAAIAAALSCAYHRARESGQALAAANLGLALDMLNTAPVLFLWLADSPAAIAGDFLGGWIGVFVGVRLYAHGVERLKDGKSSKVICQCPPSDV